jgi:acetylornithine deacetylase/succinyl-diaminopimelate desuccinylase-like protein
MAKTPPPSAASAANPGYDATLPHTCVATQLSAGHAPNALPQRATANVNCRIFPGRTQEEIQKHAHRRDQTPK